MSKEENNSVENTENAEKLDFQDAKDMTVGEAVRKDSEIKAGVTEDDGVLDRYIKQHRDEVASQKFDTKSDDFQNIDTSALDNFIKQQRQELADTGLIDPIEEDDPADKEPEDPKAAAEEVHHEHELEDTIVAPAVNPDQEVWHKAEFDDVPLTDTQEKTVPLEEQEEAPVPAASTYSRSGAASDDLFDDFDEDDEPEEKPFYKRKRVIIPSLIVLCLLAGGIAYGAYQFSNQPAKTNKTTKTSTSTKKKTDFAAVSETFEKSYAAFFADAKRVKLKNSQFANMPKLEKTLKKLKGSKYYDEAKKKYDSLKRQFSAINAVNGKFKSNAIVDGAKKAATVKDDANFDDISEKTLNTGNATLDALLKSVIADGRKQLEAKKKANNAASSPAANTNSNNAAPSSGNSGQNAQNSASDSASSAAADNSSNSAAGNNKAPSAPAQAAPSSGSSNAASSSGASGHGISNYEVSKLQRNRSRVPYDQAKIADSGNPAWTFNAGVLEKIVAISQKRGYITGNNYILEKVNIINGNGYYNMFKPDGTYLFSINCKTGYFVGNASGNSDKLDF
ncbi:cell division site-positioning protein MapZ family protein [Streptococcus devriesei]|uniref:cell division site-positioning protein MapZ family protein n=1 Tax=Streptococcus devriesei TaxID=231233 RepID=UPI0003F6E9BD|nr:cell division site-positioning protein MapZ family protein [Streptococcus devriesei]